MHIGRDRGLGSPGTGQSLELAELMGPRSAERIRAGGMHAASNRSHDLRRRLDKLRHLKQREPRLCVSAVSTPRAGAVSAQFEHSFTRCGIQYSRMAGTTTGMS